MKYFYCDSCFLITSFQDHLLGILSQYKHMFFVSETQIKDELIKPVGLADKIRESVTVIEENRQIIIKTNELFNRYESLSYYDCLSLAFCIIDGYCLVTDDKALIKKCKDHQVITKTTKDIINEFIK